MPFDQIEAVTGSREFLQRIYGSYQTQISSCPVLLSATSAGQSVQLSLHRSTESGYQLLWKGGNSFVVCLNRQLLILPLSRKGERATVCLDLDLHHPVENELKVSPPLAHLQYVSVWHERLWVQDDEGKIFALSFDGESLRDVISGPVVRGRVHGEPVSCILPDGGERVILSSDEGILALDPESMELEANLSYNFESSSLPRVYSLREERILLAERHSLTAMTPAKECWQIEWRHPLRSWTNGVTHPVFLNGMIWYGTGDGQIVGLVEDKVQCVKALADSRICTPRGLLALQSENSLLVADRGGTMVVLDVLAQSTQMAQLAEILEEATREVIVDGIWLCNGITFFNWRPAGSVCGTSACSTHQWRVTPIKVDEEGFHTAGLTEPLGLLVNVFNAGMHCAVQNGDT